MSVRKLRISKLAQQVKIKPSVSVIKEEYGIKIAEDLANTLMGSESDFEIISSDKSTDTIVVKFYNAHIEESV
tara:strand:+ start:785 stop:1003 length:219 start_codon:yes stop_codon:yes gene_type:complete